MNFKPNRYRIPFLQVFGFSHAGLDRHQVAAVAGSLVWMIAGEGFNSDGSVPASPCG